MPLISFKMTTLTLSLLTLIKVKLFWLHKEGIRVPVIVPHPKLLRLNITGAKKLCCMLLILLIITMQLKKEGRLKATECYLLIAGMREDQSWHN